VKDPLEQRTEELTNHLLSNAVADSGDTQGPGFSRFLEDVDAAQRAGLVSPVLQLPHQGQQVLCEILLVHT